MSYWTGKTRSEETKEKIRKSLLGRTLSGEHKKKIGNSLKGRVCPQSVRENISNAKKGRSNGLLGKKRPMEVRRKMSESTKGEKSYAWRGGLESKNRTIRHGLDYRLWREAVFTRDNWTCQVTGVRGLSLHPHHLQNFSQYPELRFAIDNGITLSEKAHKEFHKIYGKQNNTKEQMEEYLNSKNCTHDKE